MSWFRSIWKALSGAPATGGPGSPEPMHNFTPHAQQTLAFARKEADRFNHNFVGTEHLLLGLIRLGQGTAVTVLRSFGLDLDTVRREVEKQVGTGPDQKCIGNIPYTPRVKKVLALAVKEARALSHSYVGTEHILLGLLSEGDGVAARVLKNLGVDTEKTRREVLKQLEPNGPGAAREPKTSEEPQNAQELPGRLRAVDTSKRYDVYCRENGQELVIYRNALFKGRRKLLSSEPYGFGSEFLELEQFNGQTVYLSAFSVVKFCTPGAEMSGEIIPPGPG